MTIFRRQQNLNSWIGYSRSKQESSFAWSDNFTGTFGADKIPAVNNEDNFLNEDCIFVQSNGTWSIDWCYNRHAFICRLESPCGNLH